MKLKNIGMVHTEDLENRLHGEVPDRDDEVRQEQVDLVVEELLAVHPLEF